MSVVLEAVKIARKSKLSEEDWRRLETLKDEMSPEQFNQYIIGVTK